MDSWNISFLLGWPIFRCYVTFREYKWIVLRAAPQSNIANVEEFLLISMPFVCAKTSKTKKQVFHPTVLASNGSIGCWMSNIMRHVFWGGGIPNGNPFFQVGWA